MRLPIRRFSSTVSPAYGEREQDKGKVEHQKDLLGNCGAGDSRWDESAIGLSPLALRAASIDSFSRVGRAVSPCQLPRFKRRRATRVLRTCFRNLGHKGPCEPFWVVF